MQVSNLQAQFPVAATAHSSVQSGGTCTAPQRAAGPGLRGRPRRGRAAGPSPAEWKRRSDQGFRPPRTSLDALKRKKIINIAIIVIKKILYMYVYIIA